MPIIRVCHRNEVKTLSYDGTLKFDTSLDSSGFQDGISKIGGMAGKAIKATTTILAGAGTAIAGLGTAAIKVGSDFEAQMARVQAISGATGAELEELKDLAVQLGADTAFSAKEAAEGMENLASAGFTTAEIMDAMPGMLDLAASSGEDLANSADIAASTLRGFGLDASQAAHVADVLAKNAAETNAAVSDTGEAMKYIAPVAHTMGISMEECAAAIGIMSDAGIKGSQAGTTLRGALTRLAKPTDVMQETMDELGLSFYDSEGRMKSLTEITEMLQDKMSGLTDEQKQNALVTLFGQESLSGMLALMDRGSDELADLTESYMNCDGAAAEMAETMQNNLQSQVEQLQGSFESLGIAVYEDVKDPLTETIKTLNEMSDTLLTAFNDDGLEGLVTQFGNCLAELSQMAMEAAPTLIDAGKSLIKSFVESIMDNSEDFATAGAELVASLASAILEVSGDLWSAGIVLFRQLLEGLAGNSEEIGASAAEMVAEIGTALTENIPLIIQAGKDFIHGFAEGMSEELPGVSALLEGFFSGFLDTAGFLVEGIVDVISGLFSVINGADPGTMEAVGRAIGTIAASIAALQVAKTVVGSVQSLFSVLGSFKTGISGIAGTIGKIVEGFALWRGGAGTLMEVLQLEFPKLAGTITKIGTAVSSVGGFFTKVVGVVSSGFSKVAGFFSTFGTTIAGIGSIIGGAILAVTNFVDMFVNGFNAVKEVLMVVGIALVAVGAVLLGVPAAIAAAVAGIVAAVSTLVIVIKDNWDSIVAFFQSIPEKIGAVVDAIVGFFQSLPERISTIISTVVQFFTELPGKIITAISTLGEQFITWGSNMLATASTVVSNIIQSIVNFFTELPYKIGYAIGFVIGTLAQWAANVINWVITTVPQIIQNIVNFFAELPGKVMTWLTNTLNNLKTWGSQMLQNAKTFASNTITGIVNFFSQLPGRVATWLTNTLNNLKNWGSQMLQNARTAASNVVTAVVNFISQLPGKVWSWLSNTISRVAQFASNMLAKGQQAAQNLVNAVINGVRNLPSQMASIGYDIVSGVWRGIQNAAGWFASSVRNFFSGIVDGVKSALGINSPSKVFAEEVGEWIPPGVGVGVEDAMPDLIRDTEDEMKMLAQKMQTAVQIETGKIEIDKNTKQTYKVERENGESFDDSKVEVSINGEIHTHVDLDGEEVGRSQTPIVDKNLGRIKTVKERGG